MNYNLKDFIEKNINLIENEEWEKIFSKAIEEKIALSLFDTLTEAGIDCFTWSKLSEDPFYEVIFTLENIRHGNQRWPGGHINKYEFDNKFSNKDLIKIAGLAKLLGFDIYKYEGKRINPYQGLTYILINPNWSLEKYLCYSSDTLFNDIDEEDRPTTSDFKHMEVI